MPKRPAVQTPKLGQILRNTTTGLTLLVVGVVGQSQHPLVNLFLLGNALRQIAQKHTFVAPALNAVADAVQRIQYVPGTILLGDGTGFSPSPWPPAGWEVAHLLQGSFTTSWKPSTPEALALEEQLAEKVKAQEDVIAKAVEKAAPTPLRPVPEA